MTPERLREILAAVSAGEMSVGDAVEGLKTLPFEDLGFAKVDHHRTLRSGLPEVVFAEGKTVDQIAEIAIKLRDGGQSILITRLAADPAKAVLKRVPELEYHELPRVAVLEAGQTRESGSRYDHRRSGRYLRSECCRRGGSHCGVHGQRGRTSIRCGSGWNSSTVRAPGDSSECERTDRGCWNGGRAPERRRRYGRLSGDRCSDQHRLWCELWWCGGAARDVELLCCWNHRRQYRQRVRSRRCGRSHQPRLTREGMDGIAISK